MNKTQSFIDFRSDTVTKPTPAMLEAMMGAEVGDDVLHEDPSVNRLEEEVASILGKEAALFVSSGTMANQIAINLHCRPGDSILCEENSHIFIYEAGAAAALSGVQFDFVKPSEWSQPGIVAARLRREDVHSATTRLLAIENTHNRGAGRVFAPALLQTVTHEAKELGLTTHCDGARLWNAAAALQVPEKDIAKNFDTIAVCFSKGLGAPVGSALCGPKSFIERARKVRKRWGGGMRQAGFLAAAASYALKNHRARLTEDHRRTHMLYNGLKDLETNHGRMEFNYPELGTNMLYFRAPGINGEAMAKNLTDQGLRMYHMGNGLFRAVLHLHITDSDIEKAVSIIKAELSES